MARESMGWSHEAAWGRVSTAIAVLFATPLGWGLLPVIMFTMAVCAALCVVLLPTVLSVIGAAVLQKSHLPFRTGVSAAVIVLGLLLNGGLWAIVYHLWLANSPR